MQKQYILLSILLVIIFLASCTNTKTPVESIAPSSSAPVTSTIDTLPYPIYASWIMVWRANDGVKPYNGNVILYPEGLSTKKGTDWADAKLRRFYFEQMRDAGINVIVADLTNGLNDNAAVRDLLKLCFENNMKLAIAVHTDNATGKDMEEKCKAVWLYYANPKIKYSEAYFKKDGKPLVVLYTVEGGYQQSLVYQNIENSYASKFTAVRGAAPAKLPGWGWQLEPYDLAVLSNDAMFITSSVKWSGGTGAWRKSLAALDYNMLTARKSNPNFYILGSYDDLHERNSWIKADTTNSLDRGWQMLDIYGAINSTVYYERVKEWIKNGQANTFVPGGIIKDGAYTISNAFSKLIFSSDPPTNKLSDDVGMQMLQRSNDFNYKGQAEKYYWFYHLGNNDYRIIHLSSALSLKDDQGIVRQTWDENTIDQVWTVEKVGEQYLFINKNTGKALNVSNADADTGITTAVKNSADSKQLWILSEIIVMNK